MTTEEKNKIKLTEALHLARVNQLLAEIEYEKRKNDLLECELAEEKKYALSIEMELLPVMGRALKAKAIKPEEFDRLYTMTIR